VLHAHPCSFRYQQRLVDDDYEILKITHSNDRSRGPFKFSRLQLISRRRVKALIGS